MGLLNFYFIDDHLGYKLLVTGHIHFAKILVLLLAIQPSEEINQSIWQLYKEEIYCLCSSVLKPAEDLVCSSVSNLWRNSHLALGDSEDKIQALVQDQLSFHIRFQYEHLLEVFFFNSMNF